MTLLFLIFMQSAIAAPPPTTAPVTATTATSAAARNPADEEPSGVTNSVEFDPTVIEASGGFSGVTAVHVKSDAGGLYTRKMDYTQKIRDSLSEMDELPARTSGGSP
jgi:hypothetical protein